VRTGPRARCGRAAGRSRAAGCGRGCPGRSRRRPRGCPRRVGVPGGGDGAFGEDGGLGCGSEGGVVVLQGVDGGGVRVIAEAALRWADPGEAFFAGVGVGAAGATGGDAVDRPEPGDVGVVAAVQFTAQAGDVFGVIGGGGFRGEQRQFGVAQAQQRGQLPGLGGWDGVRLQLPVLHDGEPGVLVDIDMALDGVDRGVGHRKPGIRFGDGWLEQRFTGAGRELGQVLVHAGPQRGGDVAGVGDSEFRAELTGTGADLADDVARIPVEVGVDVDLTVVVAADGERLFPVRPVGGRLAGCAAAQHEQVGDDLGAGGALVGAAGQPDRGDQVRQGGDLAAGGGVGGIHRPVRGEHRDDATGAG